MEQRLNQLIDAVVVEQAVAFGVVSVLMFVFMFMFVFVFRWAGCVHLFWGLFCGLYMGGGFGLLLSDGGYFLGWRYQNREGLRRG